jgi:nicotinamidase-related amidase
MLIDVPSSVSSVCILAGMLDAQYPANTRRLGVPVLVVENVCLSWSTADGVDASLLDLNDGWCVVTVDPVEVDCPDSVCFSRFVVCSSPSITDGHA